MKINRNMSAVMTNNQLLRTENNLAASMERLSSGYKINHPGDNPAGMAISNKMKAQIDALNQAESNASDGVSVLQIADGALNEVSSILQRMRELSVQAANDINSTSDREAVQSEMEALRKEVDRISTDTEYNTKTLLDGSSDVRVYSENATRIDISDHVVSGTYKVNVIEAKQATASFTVDDLTAEIGQEGTISINGVSVSVTKDMTKGTVLDELAKAAETGECNMEKENVGVGSKVTLTSTIYGAQGNVKLTTNNEALANAMGLSTDPAKTSEDGKTYTMLDEKGTDAKVTPISDTDSAFTSMASASSKGNKITVTDQNGVSISFLAEKGYTGDIELEVTEIGSMTIQIGGNEFQTMEVRIPEVSSETLYLDTIDVTTVTGSDRAIETLDEAIAKVSEVRSRIGASQNRLDYASNSLSESQEDMTSAFSNLMDTDMATEMTEYTQQNVLDQAAISVLAQANDLPQQVLSLLSK